MNLPFRLSDENDLELCLKYGRIFVWLQAAATLFMLANTVTVLFHAVLLALLAVTLLLVHKLWEKCAVRVVCRVLVGLMMPLLLLFIADIAVAVIGNGSAPQSATWAGVVVLGAWPLTALMPAAFAMAARRGRYDRVVLCLYQTVALICAAIGVFAVPDAIVWLWDNDKVRYVWFGLVAAATIMSWLCSLIDPERAARRAKKKGSAAEKKEDPAGKEGENTVSKNEKAAATVVCPHCGASNTPADDDRRVCAFCGRSFDDK